MKKTKKIKIGIVTVMIIIIALFFHYTLPRTAVVQISGTDIKRVDKNKEVTEEESETANKVTMGGHTSDVRYINSVSRKGKTMVFRNFDLNLPGSTDSNQ